MAIQNTLKIWTLGVVRRDDSPPYEIHTRAIIGLNEQELKDELVKYLLLKRFIPDEMNKLTINEIREAVKDYVLVSPVSVQDLWFADGVEVKDANKTT